MDDSALSVRQALDCAAVSLQHAVERRVWQVQRKTDEEIAAISAWLVKNKMVAQVTLAGKLTLTPKEEMIYVESTKRTNRGF